MMCGAMAALVCVALLLRSARAQPCSVDFDGRSSSGECTSNCVGGRLKTAVTACPVSGAAQRGGRH